MKKIKFFSFASALMLAGAMGFSSCSSDSDVVETGGGVAGQTVKTQFAINIPYAKGENNARGTRMTDKNTQANGNFLGIQNLQLLTFDADPSNDIQTQSATNASSSINIGTGDNAYDKDKWRSIYRDISIPIGTKYFVLYGRAGRQNEDNNATAGSLTVPSDYTTATNLSALKFNLTTIAGNSNFGTNAQASAIIQALNKVANTSIEKDGKTIKWSEIEKATDLGTEAEREILAARYKNIISLKAGSAASVKATLNNVLVFFGDDFDENSKPLTAKIVNNCYEAITNLTDITFPLELGLPDGVANISFNSSTSEFTYASSSNTAIGSNNLIDYTKIAFPAALAYYTTSPAMVSSKELTAVNSLPAYDAWTKNDDAWNSMTDWNETAVTSGTRSVALKKPLQYGVANLKLSVRCADNKLADNAQSQGQKQDNNINVPAGGFTVSAVLVGGQPAGVNWNFEAPANDGFKHTIYDNVMNKPENGDLSAKYETSPSQYNYTLVLDNNNCNTKGKVYVTVELINTAGDFYGKDGLVPQNGKFYLVGLLDIDKEGLDKKGLDRIFVKDHTTEANLTITSLKNAYNCIPDLRSSNISVGLAVDLKWQEGIKFDIDI